MEIKELLIPIALVIGTVLLVVIVPLVFSSNNAFRKNKLRSDRAKKWGLDEIATSWARSNPDISATFKEIIVHGKTCFYHQLQSGKVIFLKIHSGRIRIGFLINHFVGQQKFSTVKIPLDLPGDNRNRYEELGMETGFQFLELEYKDYTDWENEYNALIDHFGASKIEQLEQRLGLLTIDEYLDRINNQSEKSLRKY